ncbi:MAG: DUF1573 domain-containing protein [Muribaculaceae bacterium]|nr:DUF1573 domain-containing protein [Muribaculaceae bacterium]
MKRNCLYKGRFIPLVTACGAIMCTLAPSVYAEISKSLEFIPEAVDFGMIREDDGKVSRKVKAVNVSGDSTFIISARTSCGCSAAEFSDAVIAPGDTTEVTVSYDPVNRPGMFLKTVRFFTGEERIGNSIKLKGTVIPSRSNLDRSYPDSIGRLRVSTKAVTLGEMSRTEARPLFVGVYNDSDRRLALTAGTDSAPMEAAMAPDTIEPFCVGTLSLMIKGRLIPDSEMEFVYNAFIMDSETGDTIATIPVGGLVKSN